MSNVLSKVKQEQVVALGRLGWSLRRIERETGVRRETAAGYLRAAGVEIRPVGRWGRAKPAIEVSTDSATGPSDRGGLGDGAAAKPAKEVSTDSKGPEAEETCSTLPQDARRDAGPHLDTPLSALPTGLPGLPSASRGPQASACEPFRDFIEDSLRKGRNAMAIWQDLVDDHGFISRYASVRRFVKKLRGDVGIIDAHPFIVTAPGEEAQVDYGEGPMVRHPETGKYRRTRMFVLTLGYSRKSVRLLVWKSGSREWCELHERAFRRLGGVPLVVVLDNLKEGVLKPDVWDPLLNPLYRDMLAHYGATAITCKVQDPNRKGKVESAVGHAQKTPLKGLRFESIEEAQARLDRWEEHWGDTRIHGTVKRQVAAMFAEEKPTLQALPVAPFRYYKFGKRTVHLNGCVEVDGAYYGPPPGYIGRVLDVQWDGRRVRILDPKSGALLRELDRVLPGRAQILEQDKPKRTPVTTLKLLQRAKSAGTSIGIVCERIHGREGELGVRRILGVLGLAKRRGVERVEEACMLALEVDVPTYRFVKRYVDKLPAPPLSLRQVDPLIRQLSLYRDLIDRKPQGEVK